MNDVAASMNTATERAIAAIGADDPSADWILRPVEHAAKLPAEAGALRRILTRESLRATMESYSTEDENALQAQSRYKAAGRRTIALTLLATLIGAASLLPPLGNLPNELKASVTAVEYISLLIAFLAARYLAVARPFPKWMHARARAELARVKLFDGVAREHEPIRDGELPLLPLKLEYFRRYQLEVQSRYYGGRGRQHQRAAGHTKRWQRASLALSVLTALIIIWVCVPIVAFLCDQLNIALPSLLRRLVEITKTVPIDDDRWLLALGVAGSAFYEYATSRSLMDLDERNASRYLTNCDNLQFLAEGPLREAREAAAAGDEAKVLEFVKRVQNLISSEHKEWVSLRVAIAPYVATPS